jgi:hypothetical protein
MRVGGVIVVRAAVECTVSVCVSVFQLQRLVQQPPGNQGGRGEKEQTFRILTATARRS